MSVRKEHCAVKIFYFLQKNGALNYDYDSLVKKIGDFRQ